MRPPFIGSKSDKKRQGAFSSGGHYRGSLPATKTSLWAIVGHFRLHLLTLLAWLEAGLGRKDSICYKFAPLPGRRPTSAENASSHTGMLVFARQPLHLDFA